MPHKCSYLPSKRPSLYEELQAIPDDLHQRKKVIDEMNYNSWRAYHHSSSSKDISKDGDTAIEWVKVVRLNPTTPHAVEYSTGKLVKITSASIFEPMVSVQEQCANFASSGNSIPPAIAHDHYSEFKSLAEIWRGAGHRYPDPTNIDLAKCRRQRDSNKIRAIRQVIVDFGSKQSDESYGFYVYPADKVFRLGAGIQLNEDEFEALQFSMQEQGRQWLDRALLCDRTFVPSPDIPENLLQKLERVSAMPVEALCNQMNLHGGRVGDGDRVVHLAVRDGLRASEGFVLLAVDYCQIELRLLTHYCADPDLCAAFSNDADVFVSIAARWNNKAELDVCALSTTILALIIHNGLCYAVDFSCRAYVDEAGLLCINLWSRSCIGRTTSGC